MDKNKEKGKKNVLILITGHLFLFIKLTVE